MPALELQEFLARIQSGDEGTVEAVLQELDPFLRRVIRMRFAKVGGRADALRMRVNRAVAAVLTEQGDKG